MTGNLFQTLRSSRVFTLCAGAAPIVALAAATILATPAEARQLSTDLAKRYAEDGTITAREAKLITGRFLRDRGFDFSSKYAARVGTPIMQGSTWHVKIRARNGAEIVRETVYVSAHTGRLTELLPKTDSRLAKVSAPSATE